MIRSRLLAISAVLSACFFTACEGFREAMTAHVDFAARAGSQELSVTRLADMLGNSQAPLNGEVAKAAANLWVDYQLLGEAAAHNDSLTNPKLLDDALWPVVAQAKGQKWFEVVSKTWTSNGDSAASAARYAQGDLLAARHILIAGPPGAGGSANKDSLRRKAETIRAQVTPANFAQLAAQNSTDPGSRANGGLLPIFRRGQMVPEFEKATLALKPGEISPLVETRFGYHIIYRPKYAEVKSQFDRAANGGAMQAAESTYFAKLESSAKVQVKPNAAATVKAVATDPDAHRGDRTVLATTTSGEFTAGRFAQYLDGASARERAQLPNLPDSVMPMVVRQFVRNDLFIRQADSAKVGLTAGEMATLRGQFSQLITNSWRALGVDPKMLADSGRTVQARERVAAAHVDSYFDQLLQQRAQMVSVPTPLERLLHRKYEAKVNPAGLTRAVERAQQVRRATDSTRVARQPASVVPMPGGAPQPSSGQAAPQPAPQSPETAPPAGKRRPAERTTRDSAAPAPNQR